MKTSSTKPFQSHNLFELLLLFAVTKNEEYFGLFTQTTRGLETSNLNIKRNILKQVLDLLHLQIQSLFSLIKSYFSISVKVDATVLGYTHTQEARAK